jgi:hypothetical protein
VKRPLLLAALIAAMPSPALAEGWVCEVFERGDPNRPAHMWVPVNADRSRGLTGFMVSWASQPGHIAEQQYNWLGIPADATLLWQPDEIELGIRSPRTDPRGWIVFTSPGAQPVHLRAERAAHWLRDFRMTWVSASQGLQVAPLWAGRNWTAALFDRRGRPLGRQPLQLPDRAAMQAMFTRMKTELDRLLTDPARHCRAIPDPTPEELEQQVI